MIATFEVRQLKFKGLNKDCVVWYEPDYDMYQGAILADDTVRIIHFVDCKEYSKDFIARPSLIGLSFGTVSRLYDLLVTNKASWRANHHSNHTVSFLETMAQRLEKLRQSWKKHGYHEDWVAKTDPRAPHATI